MQKNNGKDYKNMINHFIKLPEDELKKKKVPKQLIREIEEHRQYRFQLIMDVPPEKFLYLVRRQMLPWQ